MNGSKGRYLQVVEEEVEGVLSLCAFSELKIN